MIEQKNYFSLTFGSFLSASAFSKGSDFRNCCCKSQSVIPSVIAIDKQGKVLTGPSAKRFKNSSKYSVIQNWNQIIGCLYDYTQISALKELCGVPIVDMGGFCAFDVILENGHRLFTPADLCYEVSKTLLQMFKQTNKSDLHLVSVAIPHHFNQQQRTVVQETVYRSLVDEGFYAHKGKDDIRLIEEPVAASVSCKGKGIQVYFDLGASSADITVVNSNGVFFDVLCTASNKLGGAVLDRMIANDFLVLYKETTGQDLLEGLTDQEKSKIDHFLLDIACEKKHQLSKLYEVNVLLSDLVYPSMDDFCCDFVYTRKRLEQIIRPLVEKSMNLLDQLLREHQLSNDMISTVIPIGGSSLIPLVTSMLKDRYPDKLKIIKNPTTCISMGACQSLLPNNVTMSLGILSVSNDKGEFVTPFICDLRCEKEKTLKFYTCEDNQQFIKTWLIQMNGKNTELFDENKHTIMKDLRIPLISREKAQTVSIIMNFKYKANGMIHLQVIEKGDQMYIPFDSDLMFLHV